MVVLSCLGCNDGKLRELRILQLNIWWDATVVPGAFEALVDEIARLDVHIAVSYTHLDVYKRQPVNNGLDLEMPGARYSNPANLKKLLASRKGSLKPPGAFISSSSTPPAVFKTENPHPPPDPQLCPQTF